MISTTDFRGGLKIEYNGEPYTIIEFQHVKPGKGAAFAKTKMKNMLTGNVLERNFRSGEKFESPDIEEKEMQYLYAESVNYYFMDVNNYEQLFIPEAQMGGAQSYLKENMYAKVIFYKGKAISVEPPMFVELKIVETPPGVKGDTATGGSKQAKLETGAWIKVPLHLEEGTVVKVDSRSGTYIERVSK
ncbi:MAG TPA: elongation factor P [Nitrospiria bacterium]|nr:elongation factor P [Nitrospiria bacterium]